MPERVGGSWIGYEPHLPYMLMDKPELLDDIRTENAGELYSVGQIIEHPQGPRKRRNRRNDGI